MSEQNTVSAGLSVWRIFQQQCIHHPWALENRKSYSSDQCCCTFYYL